MRKVLLAAWCVLLAHTAMAEPTREELAAKLKALEQSKQNAAELKQKATLSQRDLEAVQERAAALAERLQTSEQRVSRQEDALADTNSKLAQKQREFNARKEEYAKTVVNLLRMRAIPPTALFANKNDVHELLRAASVMQNTNGALAREAAELQAQMRALRGLKNEAKTRQALTETERATLKSEQEKLNRELAIRQRAQRQLTAEQREAEANVAELSRQSQNLQELIDKVEAARAARPTTPPPSKEASRPVTASTLKGLRLPVLGQLVHRFGEAKNSNETWRGTLIRTRTSATVVSPADGEVVFTGPFRDYGNMVLVKHKSGLISLIAGLGEVRANLGQKLLKGEPLGVMPNAPSPQAYIELRDRTAKPIDPGVQ